MGWRGTTKSDKNLRHRTFRQVIMDDPNSETAAHYRTLLKKEGGSLDGLPEPTTVQASTEIPEPAVQARRSGGGGNGHGRPEPKPTPGEIRFIERLLAERDTDPISGGVNLNQVLMAKFQNGSLTKREAREFGDWLKNRPYKGQPVAGKAAAPVRPATPKQVSHVIKEGARRRHSDAATSVTVDKARSGEFVGFDEASHALDVLFAAPFIPFDSGKVTEDGMYAKTIDGQRVFFKVQQAVHGSGRLYAKRLVRDQDTDSDWSFEFESGAIRLLTPADKLTAEEAKEFGKLYGVCCVCATVLTDEKSIAEGIGPVCGGRI